MLAFASASGGGRGAEARGEEGGRRATPQEAVPRSDEEAAGGHREAVPS